MTVNRTGDILENNIQNLFQIQFDTCANRSIQRRWGGGPLAGGGPRQTPKSDRACTETLPDTNMTLQSHTLFDQDIKTYCVTMKRKRGEARHCVIVKFQVFLLENNVDLTCTDAREEIPEMGGLT